MSMIEVSAVNQAIADLIHGRTPEEWQAAMRDVYKVAYECMQHANDAVGEKVACERVSRGAAYLDDTYPGWRDRMPDGWSIDSTSTCPLSSATGLNYSQTREWTRLGGWDFTVAHGFMIDGTCASWQLQAAWEAELAD